MSTRTSRSARPSKVLLSAGLPTEQQILKLYTHLTGHEATPADRDRVREILAKPLFTVRFTPNDRGNPAGKLADAELHFTNGPLDGLKLVGFALWERRGGGHNVTFPARQYSVNGERRSFALLRPIADTLAQDRLRDVILEAYAQQETDLNDAEPQGVSE